MSTISKNLDALQAAGITIEMIAGILNLRRCSVHQALHGTSMSRRVWACLDSKLGWPQGTAEANARKEAQERKTIIQEQETELCTEKN